MGMLSAPAMGVFTYAMEKKSRNARPRFQVFIESVEASDTGAMRRAYQLILKVASKADRESADTSTIESKSHTSQHRTKRP